MTNKNMPRTFGDGLIHASHFDAIVQNDSHPLHLRKLAPLGETEKKIGQIIANELVDDGATLQMGKT